jgi:hypothetical protein
MFLLSLQSDEAAMSALQMEIVSHRKSRKGHLCFQYRESFKKKKSTALYNTALPLALAKLSGLQCPYQMKGPLSFLPTQESSIKLFHKKQQRALCVCCGEWGGGYCDTAIF